MTTTTDNNVTTDDHEGGPTMLGLVTMLMGAEHAATGTLAALAAYNEHAEGGLASTVEKIANDDLTREADERAFRREDWTPEGWDDRAATVAAFLLTMPPVIATECLTRVIEDGHGPSDLYTWAQTNIADAGGGADYAAAAGAAALIFIGAAIDYAPNLLMGGLSFDADDDNEG